MKIGDSIKVKKGVLDNEFEKYDTSGWQGRIIEIDPTDGVYFEVELDSITLKCISKKYIQESLDSGSDYAIIDVCSKDVEQVNPRDTVKQVQAVRMAMNRKLNYVSVLDEIENGINVLSWSNIIYKVRNQRLTYEDFKNPSLN